MTYTYMAMILDFYIVHVAKPGINVRRDLSVNLIFPTFKIVFHQPNTISSNLKISTSAVFIIYACLLIEYVILRL